MIWFNYDGAAEAVSFDELDWDSKIEYAAESGVSERGYLYEKKKYERRIYQIIVSADAIWQEADLDFLEAFWVGTGRQISFDGIAWLDVLPNPGAFPKSRLENARRLPEVAFELRGIAPSGVKLAGEEFF